MTLTIRWEEIRPQFVQGKLYMSFKKMSKLKIKIDGGNSSKRGTLNL